MDPASILMCVNIPRGITEDLLCELFCVAGPIEDVSISRSGRSCFIVYESEEAVKTAKEIFQDVKLYGRPLEMFDKNDIQSIHEEQEEESKRQLENDYSNVSKHHRFDSDGYFPRCNPFHNFDAMTPNRKDFQNSRGRPNDYHNMNPSNSRNAPSSENDRMQSKFDLFKSPYQQPVSRNTYEHLGYHGGGDASNYHNNRTSNSYQKRHSEFPSTTDPVGDRDLHIHQKRHSEYLSPSKSAKSNDYRSRHSTEFSSPSEYSSPDISPNFGNRKRPNESAYPIPTESNHDSGGKKQKNNNFYDGISDVYPVEDIEQQYEEQVRRQFQNSPRKPYRDGGHSKYSNYKNTPSTSSDYVVRNKSREFDRSPYARRDQHGSRHSNQQNHNNHRNRRR